MLRRLKIQNFKSWRDLEIDCNRITALFGTNSSGKSAILQFLLLIKQTRESRDRREAISLNGPYLWLGSFRDISFAQTSSTISAELEFALENELTIKDPDTPSRRISSSRSFTISFEIGPKEIQSRAHSPRAGSRQLVETKRLEYKVGDSSFSLDNGKLLAQSVDFKFKRRRGRPPFKIPGSKFYSFPDKLRRQYDNADFLLDLESTFESRCDKIFYLGPLRERPQIDYLWSGSRPVDVGQRGERAIDAIVAATTEGMGLRLPDGSRKRGKVRFEEAVAYWLQQLGLVEAFRIEELAEGANRWHVRVRVSEKMPEVRLVDVGFGISQVLPVIVLLCYVPEDSIVLLEQPEIHLHPLAQANLADMMIWAASRRNVQIIVESHSEHLLLRLQRRIAEGNISAADMKVYFCSSDKGESKIQDLDVDEYGNIRNWPKGFLGDAFGETLAAEQARLERMKQR